MEILEKIIEYRSGLKVENEYMHFLPVLESLSVLEKIHSQIFQQYVFLTV